MEAWLQARKAYGISLHAPMLCVLQGPSKGARMRDTAVRGAMKKHAQRVGLDRRVTAESLRKSGEEHRKGSRSRIVAHLAQYLDDEAFQLQFPEAFERWESALDQYTAHPTRDADRVGHDCRNAMASFMSAKLAMHGVEPSGSGTFAQLSDLIASVDSLSDAVAKQLKAVKTYWSAISGLAQRQEHAGQREREALTEEDSQRLIASRCS